jgi:predicted Rossmann fold nucleotide-binding protein DprA/Smf involved in DNA uptake
MMLRDGAIVIASVDDAIALVGAEARSSTRVDAEVMEPAGLRQLQPDDPEAARILSAIRRGARSIDALVESTSLTPRDVLGAVSALELRGLVRRDASGLAVF